MFKGVSHYVNSSSFTRYYFIVSQAHQSCILNLVLRHVQLMKQKTLNGCDSDKKYKYVVFCFIILSNIMNSKVTLATVKVIKV